MLSFGQRLHPRGDVVVNVGGCVILHSHLRLRRPAGGAIDRFKSSRVGLPAAVGGPSRTNFLSLKAEIKKWGLAIGRRSIMFRREWYKSHS